jgi:hypothetical protein
MSFVGSDDHGVLADQVCPEERRLAALREFLSVLELVSDRLGEALPAP